MFLHRPPPHILCHCCERVIRCMCINSDIYFHCNGLPFLDESTSHITFVCQQQVYREDARYDKLLEGNYILSICRKIAFKHFKLLQFCIISYLCDKASMPMITNTIINLHMLDLRNPTLKVFNTIPVF